MSFLKIELLDAPAFLNTLSLSTRKDLQELAKWVNAKRHPVKIFQNPNGKKEELQTAANTYFAKKQYKEEVVDESETAFRKHKNEELYVFIKLLENPLCEKPKVNKRSNKDELWNSFRTFAVEAIGKPKKSTIEKEAKRKREDANGESDKKKLKLHAEQVGQLQQQITDLKKEKETAQIIHEQEIKYLKQLITQKEEVYTKDLGRLDIILGALVYNAAVKNSNVMVKKESNESIETRKKLMRKQCGEIQEESLRNIVAKYI